MSRGIRKIVSLDSRPPIYCKWHNNRHREFAKKQNAIAAQLQQQRLCSSSSRDTLLRGINNKTDNRLGIQFVNIPMLSSQ